MECLKNTHFFQGKCTRFSLDLARLDSWLRDFLVWTVATPSQITTNSLLNMNSSTLRWLQRIKTYFSFLFSQLGDYIFRIWTFSRGGSVSAPTKTCATSHVAASRLLASSSLSRLRLWKCFEELTMFSPCSAETLSTSKGLAWVWYLLKLQRTHVYWLFYNQKTCR